MACFALQRAHLGLDAHDAAPRAKVVVVAKESAVIAHLAHVLAPAAAHLAGAARVADPADAHAVANLEPAHVVAGDGHLADALMARHEREVDHPKVIAQHVHVRVAEACARVREDEAGAVGGAVCGETPRSRTARAARTAVRHLDLHLRRLKWGQGDLEQFDLAALRLRAVRLGLQGLVG